MRKRMGSLLVLSMLTAGITGSMAGCGDAVKNLPTAVQKSEIYVEKVDGISEQFIMGADVSSYSSLSKAGIDFFDYDGEKLSDQDFFALLHDSGVNVIRLRVWNDPYDENGNGYGGGNCDLDTAIEMGKLATRAGMKVQVDFHYSDFWADPNKQMRPKAWKDLSMEEMAKELKVFTKKSLAAMLEEGIDVTMVQIGNETNGWMCETDNWDDLCMLFSAGSEAVREVSAEQKQDILVALHFADVQNGHYLSYAKKLENHKVDYDVFASSYYPYWHGSVDKLTEKLGEIAQTYDKYVYITETSWAYTLADGDGNGNTVSEGNNDADMPYDFSVQGQATEVALLVKAMAEMGDKGLGVCYWEPAWIGGANAYDKTGNMDNGVYERNKKLWEEKGCGWASSFAGSYDANDAGKYYGGSAVDNQAWFDFDGHPLESLRTYLYCRTGTTAEKPKLLVHEKEEQFTSEEGNYLINGTFEDNLKGWQVRGFNTEDAASNAHSGEGCMHFWSQGGDCFTASQTVSLEVGTYELSAFLQGGDAGANDRFEIAITIGEDTKTATASVSGWKDFKELTIPELIIEEDNTEAIITITADISGGAWGSFDDVFLVKKE